MQSDSVATELRATRCRLRLGLMPALQTCAGEECSGKASRNVNSDGGSFIMGRWPFGHSRKQGWGKRDAHQDCLGLGSRRWGSALGADISWGCHLRNVASEVSTDQTDIGGSHQEMYSCVPDPEAAHAVFHLSERDWSSSNWRGGWGMWFSPVPKKKRKRTL